MNEDRYRVVLIDGAGQAESWLSPRLKTTNAAWEAGEFSWAEAKDLARFAGKHIKGYPAWYRWHVVPVAVAEVVA